MGVIGSLSDNNIIMGTTQQLDWKIKHAQDVIFDTYGDTVSVDAKKKDLIKFGFNSNVGTSRATIWYTGQDDANETYVAANTNSIDSFSTNNVGDTSLSLRVEGHTETGGNKTFVVQNVSTDASDGRTRVALTTALNRINRVSVNGSTDNIGEIYVYENTSLTGGKPTDTAKIHLTVPAAQNQSRKASTSLSSTDYWIVTGFSGGSLEKTGSNTTEVQLEVRESGGVWKIKAKPIVFQTGNDTKREYNPYVIVPKNADVRLTALSSTTGQETNGDIQGYLASVQ